MRHQTRPQTLQPKDFQPFWQNTLLDLEKINPGVEVKESKNTADGLYESLGFTSWDFAPIWAYRIRVDATQKRPLVVHSHGYNGQCEIKWDWAKAGFNVFGVDIRGFGRSANANLKRSRWGYVLSGIESPETSILRGAVCDYLRAVQIAREIFGKTISKLVIHGESFAGGLALMAEAILNQADLLAVGIPSFGWTVGRHFFVQSGSGKEINDYLEKRADQAEDIWLVLSYFDPINFAKNIHCPTLFGVGLKDEVVPPETVYAIANHMTAPRKVMEFPVSHSDSPEKQHWEKFEQEWMKLILKGIPKDFG